MDERWGYFKEAVTGCARYALRRGMEIKKKREAGGKNAKIKLQKQ